MPFRDHCEELGNAVPTKPMLFMKPPSSYLEEGAGPILVRERERERELIMKLEKDSLV